jgi:hypothetical protein
MFVLGNFAIVAPGTFYTALLQCALLEYCLYYSMVFITGWSDRFDAGGM